MTDGLLPRLFWRALDRVDYWLMLARLRILDALAGPLPETPANQHRQRDHEKIERAFPKIHEEPGGIVEDNDPWAYRPTQSAVPAAIPCLPGAPPGCPPD